jgi:hypothetical protein
MSEIHFDTLQDALQHANDRIDVALARTIQLEAITDAHHALLSAVAATHPDPVALREEWRRISSLIVASSQIRPPDDAAMEIRAEQTQAQVELISEILDGLAAASSRHWGAATTSAPRTSSEHAQRAPWTAPAIPLPTPTPGCRGSR